MNWCVTIKFDVVVYAALLVLQPLFTFTLP